LACVYSLRCDEVELFGKWARDGYLKEAARLRMRDQLAVRCEENCDLFLNAARHCSDRRNRDVSYEKVRISRHERVLCEREIVAVESRAIDQFTRAEKRRCRWIGCDSIPNVELKEHRFRRHAWQRTLSKIRRAGQRTGRLRYPLHAIQHLL